MPMLLCGRRSSWLSSSADHLVRLEEERWGNGEAEGLGGLQVDHQLELRRLLDGQVGGFGTLQDTIHIDGSATAHVYQARPVGHQAPRIHIHPDKKPALWAVRSTGMLGAARGQHLA